MTHQDIEVFLAVVRAGSISGAARALYLTQPAVSRHIRQLEEELGCPLLRRGRGMRRAELTGQGETFVQVARKWRALWQETREVARQPWGERLSVSSIGSVATYLLPPALRDFLRRHAGCALEVSSHHSLEAYHYVEQGLVDVALVSDDMYARGVETTPAFREPMVLVVSGSWAGEGPLHPTRLDPGRELRLPWNPEYDLWHEFWFQAAQRPQAVLDQMALLEECFSWGESWAVMPLSAARAVVGRRQGVIRPLEEGPPDRIIYYLQGARRKPELTAAFLACLKRALAPYPEIECFL